MNLARPLLFTVLTAVVVALLLTGVIVLMAVLNTPLATSLLQGNLANVELWLWVKQVAKGLGLSTLQYGTLAGWPLGLQVFFSFVLLLAMWGSIRLGEAMGEGAALRGRQILIALLIASMLRHLLWRASETLGFETPASCVMGWALFIAECLSFGMLVLGCVQVWQPTNRAKQAPALNTSIAVPSVDVMVCTYNESISVLYRTLVGCMAMEYPKKTVYLLDDGRRSEMEQLAAFLGVQYITRSSNANAKAGNLNNALPQSDGELVLILDADHVPSKFTLQRLVGYFQHQSRLAFVQTPQHFYNLDPFQRNLLAEEVVNNEQDFFFHVVQPGQDNWNATFFAGTGALFRRSALLTVGGFATETLTEDTHTGLRLHAKGWKSLMHNETLIAGMAQDCFSDMVKQRYRWAKGMAQILRYDHPLFKAGLSLPQRLCYFAGISYFFTGLLRLVFMLSPIGYLLFGTITIHADFLSILVFYAPSLFGLYWGYSYITQQKRHLFWSEVYESAMFLYTTLAAFTGWLAGRRGRFEVTPKGNSQDGLQFEWTLVWPQLALLLISSLALVVSAWRSWMEPLYLGGLFTNFCWGLYNIVILLTAMYVAMERPQLRLTPRVDRRVRCELRVLDGTVAVGQILNISESGVSAEFHEPLPVAGTMSLKVLDWDLNEVTVVSVQAVHSFVDPQTHHHRLGLRIVNRSDAQHQALIRHMFGDARVWNQPKQQREHWSLSLHTLLNTPFRVNQLQELTLLRRTPRFQVFLPCTVQVEGETQVLHAFTHEISESGLALVLPKNRTYPEGMILTIRLAWNEQHTSSFRTVVKRVLPFKANQQRVGVNYLRMTKEERLELIAHLYGPREGLVRVAPAVYRRLPCVLELPIKADESEPQRIYGSTFELSEMGVRIVLDRPVRVDDLSSVKLEIHWGLPAGAMTYAMQLVPARLNHDDPNLHLLYFENLSIQTLDELSRLIHLGG